MASHLETGPMGAIASDGPILSVLIDTATVFDEKSLFDENSLCAVENSPFRANEFTKICCYNAGPRATGQRAERGLDGPTTLPEGKPSSQERASNEWALDRQ